MAGKPKIVIQAGQTFVPPDARGDPAKEAFWKEDPLKRLNRFVFMDAATAEEGIAMLFGSFRTTLVQRAIAERWDLMPLLLKAAGMETPFLRLPTLGVLSNNSYLILQLLRGPRGEGPVRLREVIRQHHPDKAKLFDTPEGWGWLDWTCYNFALWIYTEAPLKGSFWYPRPNPAFALRGPPEGIEIRT